MQNEFNQEQKKSLLDLVRKILETTLAGQPVNNYESQDDLFNENRGCFVSLHNQGQLRGCIGQFQPNQPLIQTIRQMAIAATQDSRFTHNPITLAELPSIEIELSILTPLKETSGPLSLELGTDGIYITKGHQSGCFLPQVATETGWTQEQFLQHCCQDKAGLPPNAWQDPQTTTHLFQAEIFNDSTQ